MKKSNSSHNRTCCVKGCPHTPLKGRKTCGRHGRRSNAHRPRFISGTIRLDCSIPVYRIEAHDTEAAPAVHNLPADRPYSRNVTVRTRPSVVSPHQLVAIVGLPTSRENMIAFLEDWLARPAHTLADLERLTPAQLIPCPQMANAYCDAARALVLADLGHDGLKGCDGGVQ